jgi:hypothetical protein
MKRLCVLATIVILTGIAATIEAASDPTGLVVTSSNAANNALLVYDTSGALVQTVSTGGQGGVGGNAGGIATHQTTVAVVNFGSQSVSIFDRQGDGFGLSETVTTASSPVSVAFGKDHLYILGTATVESHRLDGSAVDESADGVATLVRSDGSAAQVGVIGDQLVISEKSGVIEVVGLRTGAVAGASEAVQIPAGSDTPFGLVARGDNAYVTIAHSDEISLIKNDQLVALTAIGSSFPTGPGQQAPCWITLIGSYLFTSNSPSHSISRLIATGQNIVLDDPVAAHTGGAPIDIAAAHQLLAVIESNGHGQSHLTQFRIGDDGALTQTATTAISSAANGVAIVVK